MVITSNEESANTWGSTSFRSRPWALRDGANPRRHPCSLFIRQTLRRSWFFLRVGQWSKSHSWSRMEKEFCAMRKTSCLLLYQDWHQASAQARLPHRHRRTHRVSLRVQQYHEVTIATLKHRETERSDEPAPREWCGSPSKTQNKQKMEGW